MDRTPDADTIPFRGKKLQSCSRSPSHERNPHEPRQKGTGCEHVLGTLRQAASRIEGASRPYGGTSRRSLGRFLPRSLPLGAWDQRTQTGLLAGTCAALRAEIASERAGSPISFLKFFFKLLLTVFFKAVHCLPVARLPETLRPARGGLATASRGRGFFSGGEAMPRTSAPVAQDLFLQKLRALHAQVMQLQQQYEQARREAKAAKNRLEQAQENLLRLIDLGPEQLSLFDQPPREA